MPVISHGSLQRVLKGYAQHNSPRQPCSSLTKVGYSVVKPMQLPGMSLKKGSGSLSTHSPDRGRASSQSPRSPGARTSDKESENCGEHETIAKRPLRLRSTVVKVTADVASEGNPSDMQDMDRKIPFSARSALGRRDHAHWNSLETARERAAEEDRLAGRSVKKIEIALRHMNDQKFELAEMKSQMQALLKPQLKMERVTMQRERAKTAAQIMAPHLARGLLPKKGGNPKAFFDESDLTEEEKDLRALAKKTGVDLPDVQDYKKWFDKVDADKSGVIERPEFEALMKELHPGIELRKQQMDDWWRGVDEDQSGAVTFEEFLMYWATHGS